MSKVGEFFKSHHIQLALATGASIIVLAYVSKRVLAILLSTAVIVALYLV